MDTCGGVIRQVRCTSTFEDEWVQCNPSSFANTQYAVDGIVIDGGGEIIPPGGGEPPPEDDGDNIGIRSTLGDEELLWMTNYRHYFPGDEVEIILHSGRL